MSHSRTYAIVMAGGSGTRFWPASRAHRPKQLLPLLGDGDGSIRDSLLSKTVERLSRIIPGDRTFVVTAAALADATLAALPTVPEANILAEPAPRNTAPCIGWATNVIAARDPDAVIAVLPSDHHVANEAHFCEVLGLALRAAEQRPLATVGITPTRPDTGFGYIEIGDLIDAGPARQVRRFVEKPNLTHALEYVQSGRFLWNSGMFFFRASEMQKAIARHLPKLHEGLTQIARAPGELGALFPTLPSISIDYGVVEPIAKEHPVAGEAAVAVVPGDFGWSDVGSWESAWELAPKDADGNALPHDGIAVDAKGNLGRATKGKTIALVGVHDLVVVETEDAILVMPRSRAQDVRAVVDELKKRGQTSKV